MIKIPIQGIQDSVRDIELTVPARELEEVSDVFIGDVLVEGKLRVIGKRFSFSGIARVKARLICDRSLEEFEEDIIAEISQSYIKDNDLYFNMGDKDVKDFEENVLHEDEKYIDLTEEISQQLELKIPMKKIAPQYRDKELKDIYPQYSADANNKKDKEENDIADERWSALKNIKLGKSDKKN